MQTTSNLLMIRPVDFKFNEQTAVNNKFQQSSEQRDVQDKALAEFDNFVEKLRSKDLEVNVIDDTLDPETPDSIFPNNWVSFHDDGTVFLYPMFSENRRNERRKDILDQLRERYKIEKISDLSHFEAEGIYLEGTGSLVLDRENKIAYACLSVRTNEKILTSFCEASGYKPVSFAATDADGFPIYHTNVMMCIGNTFAVVCLESIADPVGQQKVIDSVHSTGKELISISLDQMNHFAGNMLQVINRQGQPFLVMSEQAYLSLNESQVISLGKHCELIYSPLYTIEQNGGGSARCMLAEIHLPKR
jgi:hypothetical protein